VAISARGLFFADKSHSETGSQSSSLISIVSLLNTTAQVKRITVYQSSHEGAVVIRRPNNFHYSKENDCGKEDAESQIADCVC
jgi:hypothetical protein